LASSGRVSQHSSEVDVVVELPELPAARRGVAR
jgi:hypothetical protein